MEMLYTATDFQHSTPPRVFGSETEYTSAVKLSYRALGYSDSLPRSLHFNHPYWLSNGAMLYEEMDELIEYATPECRTPQQVAEYEIAGGHIVESVVADMARMTGHDPHTYKRSGYVMVGDPNSPLLVPASAGHHENYFEPVDFRFDEERLAMLTSYLATRALWAGAGIVTTGGFERYQKREAMQFLFPPTHWSDTKHGTKALYKMKGERLEIRSGDGNMSPWVIGHKFAVTSLVLRLIEQRRFPQDAVFANGQMVDSAAIAASKNPELDVTGDGIGMSGIDHQRTIMQACLDFADSPAGREVPREETQAALSVLDTLNDIERVTTDGLGLVSDRLDWAAKLHNMHTHGLTTADIHTGNLEAVQHDLMWERVGKDTPSARWYRKYGNTIGHDAVQRAMTTPPPTRAQARSNLLRNLLETEIVDDISWGEVIAGSDCYLLPNPYDHTLPHHLML